MKNGLATRTFAFTLCAIVLVTFVGLSAAHAQSVAATIYPAQQDFCTSGAQSSATFNINVLNSYGPVYFFAIGRGWVVSFTYNGMTAPFTSTVTVSPSYGEYAYEIQLVANVMGSVSQYTLHCDQNVGGAAVFVPLS